MDNNGMSPADVMALTNSENGIGGNWLAMIFLFALIFGFGNGGFGFGNNAAATALGYENLATSAEMQRGFDNQNSMANEREILAAVNSGTAQGIAAGNQNTQYMTGMLNDKYNELARDISGLGVGQAQILANQNECCGSTKMQMAEGFAGLSAAIAQNRFDAAMGNASVVQAVQAEGNATRALIQQNKIEALQDKVSQLEMQNAMAGVVRYPNQWSYNAGPSPFCNCGNACNM